MSDMQTIRDDLAFMRQVSTASAPEQMRKGGMILLAGGVIFASASLAVWAAMESLVPPAGAHWAWLAAMVVFFVVLVAVLARGPRSQGVRDKATGMAWAGMGGVIFTTVTGFSVSANVLHDPAVFAGLPTLITALYGAGWTVAGAMSGRRWMTGVALGGFVAAVVLAFLVASPAIYLAYAAVLLALAAAPGLVLLRGRG